MLKRFQRSVFLFFVKSVEYECHGESIHDGTDDQQLSLTDKYDFETSNETSGYYIDRVW